jgi:tRNA(Ile2) C34 agmatinyltransferase TiaS
LKIKALDVQRAAKIIRKDYVKTTGLNSEDLPAEEAVFSFEAETVICPACSMRFKPALRRCPDCGLQLG